LGKVSQACNVMG
jgi:transposase InsO family protein